MDQLPVEDESADIVLATYSMPLYARSEAEIVAFFKEAVRVVRPNGLLSLMPVVTNTTYSGFDERNNALRQQVGKIVSSPEWVTLNFPFDDYRRLTARKITS